MSHLRLWADRNSRVHSTLVAFSLFNCLQAKVALCPMSLMLAPQTSDGYIASHPVADGTDSVLVLRRLLKMMDQNDTQLAGTAAQTHLQTVQGCRPLCR